MPPVTEEGLSEAQELYLKQLLLLGGGEKPVSTKVLARRMGVRPASVTGMVRRLADHGLVDHEPYRGVRLKGRGLRAAMAQVRRHRLLETWLAQAMGYRWDEVHGEAERLEHHISKSLEERIDALLGFPTHDPHGDPIPGNDLKWPEGSTLRSLADMVAGQIGRVVRVKNQDPDTLGLVARLGLRPGAGVVAEGARGAGVSVKVERERFLVPREVADQLMMEVEG